MGWDFFSQKNPIGWDFCPTRWDFFPSRWEIFGKKYCLANAKNRHGRKKHGDCWAFKIF
jgi:hypothetical protein